MNRLNSLLNSSVCQFTPPWLRQRPLRRYLSLLLVLSWFGVPVAVAFAKFELMAFLLAIFVVLLWALVMGSTPTQRKQKPDEYLVHWRNQVWATSYWWVLALLSIMTGYVMASNFFPNLPLPTTRAWIYQVVYFVLLSGFFVQVALMPWLEPDPIAED
jgi:hypothetical protein